jgi:Uma2 family endonuclease
MTLALEQEPRPPQVKRWTKREYNERTRLGLFEGMHIYLFRGELIEVSPQHRPHAYAITELDDLLHLTFGIRQGFKVRVQMPFDTPGESIPEPDVLVCTDAHAQRHPHPNEALLVVEVSDSSLAVDREKALEYAAARISEYWIVDVKARQVEVYRNPQVDPKAPLGYRYPPPTIVASGQSIELLSKPGARINVAELFIPK